MTKSKIFDFFLIILLIATGSYYYFFNKKKDKNLDIKKIEINEFNITRANDILKRKSILKDDQINLTATSSACTFFLKNSAEQSMMEYANEFIDHHIEGILKQCQNALPNDLRKAILNSIEKCQNISRDNLTNDCFTSLINAKTKSIVTIVDVDSNLKNFDSSILLPIIANNIESGDYFINPENNLKIINELLLKEPNFLSGHKVKLLILTLTSLAANKTYDQEFYQSLKISEKLYGNDPDLIEIQLAKKIELYKYWNNEIGNNSLITHETLDYLLNKAKENSNHYIYDYYRAYLIFKSGIDHIEEANQILLDLKERFPNQIKILRTIERLSSLDEEIQRHPFLPPFILNLNDL